MQDVEARRSRGAWELPKLTTCQVVSTEIGLGIIRSIGNGAPPAISSQEKRERGAQGKGENKRLPVAKHDCTHWIAAAGTSAVHIWCLLCRQLVLRDYIIVGLRLAGLDVAGQAASSLELPDRACWVEASGNLRGFSFCTSTIAAASYFSGKQELTLHLILNFSNQIPLLHPSRWPTTTL
jgi:hypothetical protein